MSVTSNHVKRRGRSTSKRLARSLFTRRSGASAPASERATADSIDSQFEAVLEAIHSPSR